MYIHTHHPYRPLQDRQNKINRENGAAAGSAQICAVPSCSVIEANLLQRNVTTRLHYL